jgi:hypothetical protein
MLFEFTTFYSANEFVDGHGKRYGHGAQIKSIRQCVQSRTWLECASLGRNAPVQRRRSTDLPTTACSAWKIHRIWRWQHSHRGARRGVPQAHLHWFYEADVWLPGIGYSGGKVLNIAQHNYAAGPAAGFTYFLIVASSK